MSWWTRAFGRDEAADRGATARAIRFDTEGWRSVRERDEALEWRDALGNTLRVCFHGRPAGHLGEPDIGSLRVFCRRKADADGGAIVSVELVDVAGIPCLMAIDKYERHPSYDYKGAITIPAGGSHFVIEVNAAEHGVTGMREAVVTNHLLARGELDLFRLHVEGLRSQPIPGWFRDPYDPGYKGRALYSVPDDARFDALFPDHPLSRVRSCLARIRRTLKFDAAVPITHAPLRIDGAVEGVPNTSLISTETVASLYLQAEQYDEVEKVITDARDQAERSSTPDPMRVARHALLLGFAYEGRRNFPDAETAFRKASDDFERVLGEDHPNSAQAINNLARALIAQGKHEEAEPLFRRALRVFETAEANGSNAGVALNGLGLIYNARELYSDAIPCFERALAIFERVHGATFPDVATVLRNMAFSWKRLGNIDRMVEASERADRIDRE